MSKLFLNENMNYFSCVLQVFLSLFLESKRKLQTQQKFVKAQDTRHHEKGNYLANLAVRITCFESRDFPNASESCFFWGEIAVKLQELDFKASLILTEINLCHSSGLSVVCLRFGTI